MKTTQAIAIVIVVIIGVWFVLHRPLTTTDESQIGLTDPSRTVVLDASSNGKTINVYMGQEVTLTLPSYENGGYVFGTPTVDASILKFESSTRANGAPNVVGDFGTDSWQFQAIGVGGTDLTINAFGPTEAGGTIGVFKAHVVVVGLAE